MKNLNITIFLALSLYSLNGFSQANSGDLHRDLETRFKGLAANHLKDFYKTLKAPTCDRLIGTWYDVGYATASPDIKDHWESRMSDLATSDRYVVTGKCNSKYSELEIQNFVVGVKKVKPTDDDPAFPFTAKPPSELEYINEEAAYTFYSSVLWNDFKGIIYTAPTAYGMGHPQVNEGMWYTCRYLNDTKYNFLLCAYFQVERDNAKSHWQFQGDREDQIAAYSILSDGKLAKVNTQIQSETVTSIISQDPNSKSDDKYSSQEVR